MFKSLMKKVTQTYYQTEQEPTPIKYEVHEEEKSPPQKYLSEDNDDLEGSTLTAEAKDESLNLSSDDFFVYLKE